MLARGVNHKWDACPSKGSTQATVDPHIKLSKWEGPYVIEEVYRSGAIKINNFEGTNPRVVNGQRIKHYISGNPINVETNVIETVTPEEYIRDTFRNVSDSEKE